MQLYPSAIDDIQCEVLYKKKSKTTYCIGNVEIDNYIFVDEKQKDSIIAALNYMDGDHSSDEIQEMLLSEHGIKVNMQQLYEICAENGFVKDVDASSNSKKKGFNELDIFAVNLFSVRVEKFNKVFSFLSKHLHVVVLAMIAVTIGLLCLLYFRHDSASENFAWISLLSNATTILLYIFISSISVMLHELSHIIVAYRYGIKPKFLTVALYAYVTPMFYVRLNGIYMITPIKRILIWAAGSLMNFFIALICFTLMNYTSGLLNLFFITGLVCNLFMGIYSLLPIVISDGYYILATILKAPNLRKSSFSKTLDFFKGNFNKEGLIYVIYCILFVGILIFFLGARIYGLVTMITHDHRNGLDIFQIMRNYINILFFIFIGIVGKIITVFMQKLKGTRL